MLRQLRDNVNTALANAEHVTEYVDSTAVPEWAPN